MNANEWIITSKLLKKLQSTASFLWNLFGRTLPNAWQRRQAYDVMFDIHQVASSATSRAKLTHEGTCQVPAPHRVISNDKGDIVFHRSRAVSGERAARHSFYKTGGEISNDVMKGRLQSSDVWNHQHQTVKISQKANRGFVSQQEGLKRQLGNKSYSRACSTST